ncbi:predicted protein [Nematostella vectensis]|uniref:Protein-tyrosine-phosphatase n=1 Tax=Nematostella vectensis TaxID=45351 RepID=A7SQ18_NEMVE|nr:predicted protein [Nematostella vectensis]|eukprot:XP_001626333.1 predicted protein [Nematostella vectensis]
MLDRVNAESSLDIFNYVAYLRTRRTAMVQTEEQYTFCHDAVLEAIQCGNTQILAHDLRITLSRMEDVDKELKMTRFDSEFKTLNKVSPILPKACYIVASYPENKDKNRYSDILASDFSRVVLTAIDDNEITTYINAVHISDFPQFWPEVGKETYDMISVECSDERSSSVDNLRASYDQSEIAQLRFNVKDLRTPENLHKIKMFVVSGWTSEDETPPTSSIITLIAKVERWQQQSGNGPITVVCSDGIGRSGTFSALYSVLERVKIEQVIDVLQAIKAMRIPRPGLVKTTAEYKFIHYAVQEYLAAFDDYANFK